MTERVESPLIEEIKALYREALRREEDAEGRVRTLAYYIGKIKGLMTALEILRGMVEGRMREIEVEGAQAMEAKRAYLDNLPERRPEDYERFSREVAQITEKMREKTDLLSGVLRDFEKEVSRAVGRAREKMREEMKKRKAESPLGDP